MRTHRRGPKGAGQVVWPLETKFPSATPTESKSKAPWAAGRTWGRSGSHHRGARGKWGKSVAQLGQIILERARPVGLPGTRPPPRRAAFGHGGRLCSSIPVGRHVPSLPLPCRFRLLNGLETHVCLGLPCASTRNLKYLETVGLKD